MFPRLFRWRLLAFSGLLILAMVAASTSPAEAHGPVRHYPYYDGGYSVPSYARSYVPIYRPHYVQPFYGNYGYRAGCR